MITRALGILLLCLAPLSVSAQGFYDYWGDGRAEVSSYRVVQSRYGEDRAGYGVMIFVTEDVNRKTLIKVESPTPEPDRIYALKLNNVLKFTTGIYDYSVMTSVFSAVEPQAGVRPFELLKLNMSSQEWCGHVFEEVRFDGDHVQGNLNSYFEREGNRSWSLERSETFASEDHLLIQIRELKGPFMAEGESRQLMLLPALWQFRVQHSERSLVSATLTKGEREQITVGEATYTAFPWFWSDGTREKSVWVDAEYPHRILRWASADGSRGELMVSKRLPYWGQHDLDDEHLRDELEIPR